MDTTPNPANSTSLLPKSTTSSAAPSSSATAVAIVVTLVTVSLSLFLLLSPSAPLAATAPPKLSRPAVIILSFDGFRFGYQFKTPTPNLHRLVADGTSADLGLIPVFPSLNFPNHYSIATGLFPPHHGIVANYFSDPVTGASFTPRSHEPHWWLGEPIWETAANQGRPAAAIFWAGGEVKKGAWTCPPRYCPKYNSTFSFEDRVDTALGYFDLPAGEVPAVTAIYFSDPDKQGHKFGPDHPEVTRAVAHVDQVIGRLIDGLEKRGIFDNVHLIVVGNHGMVAGCKERYLFVEDLNPWIEIPEDWVQNYGGLLGVRPSPTASPAEVMAKMKEGLGSGGVANGDKVKLYLKEELPERFRYSDSDRIAPIVGVVDEGYRVLVSRSSQEPGCVGEHGYDNQLFSMRSIFVGRGPRFEKGKKIPSFVNVEIYNMMTDILGLNGAPNDGSGSFANSVLLPRA